jgi:SAM-dependent methyltransferase
VLRGANVIGLDISPDLVSLARERLSNAGLKADLRVASAYDTGLPNESVDVVFSMALLHHLDLPRAHTEIRRILRPGGRFILKEPIRFSRILTFLRRLFPDQEDVSDFEHPLTREELATITTDFTLIAERSFRLPTSVLLSRYTRIPKRPLWNSDRGLLRSFPKLTYLATVKVMSLWK